MSPFHGIVFVALAVMSQSAFAADAGGGVAEEARDAFQESWATPPGLVEVNLTNFEDTVQSNELSVMVFYTKFSPYVRACACVRNGSGSVLVWLVRCRRHILAVRIVSDETVLLHARRFVWCGVMLSLIHI